MLSIKDIIANVEAGKVSHTLLDVYKNATDNLDASYVKGLAFCLAGLNGVGKTSICANILKRACLKGFTCLYSNLNDIVSVIVSAPSEEKYLARMELLGVDFLVIDEFDGRFVASENSADLFGRTLENVIRTRLSNKLPTILISNSPNPVEMFQGALKVSIGSLMSKLPLIPVLGEDLRKTQLGKL